MENFDHKAYRKNLADELQNLPKKDEEKGEDREWWLNSEKGMPRKYGEYDKGLDEYELNEYELAEKLHAQDRAEVQQESREQRKNEINQKILALESQITQLKEQRTQLELIGEKKGSEAKVVEMKTGYRDNFERVELWDEFKQDAEKIILEHVNNIRELKDQGNEIRYNVGEVSIEMFNQMKDIFNIPNEVEFVFLPQETRNKFIQLRRDLEEKNHVGTAGKRSVKFVEGGF